MSVTVEMHDAVALITMDDGKANAVNPDLLAGLHDALDKAEADAKAVVLIGRPGRFSAGFDLKVLQGASVDAALDLVTAGGRFATRLFGFPMPVVAACSGHAIAMGCFLLLASDTRIGVEGDFKIGANETQIGMVLPKFATELLKARIDQRFFSQAVLQGHLFDPAGAQAVGFLDQVVAPESLLAEAMATASALTALPTQAYGGNKLEIRKEVLQAMQAGS